MISEPPQLQALPAAVYETDAEGRITFYNEAAAELWGRSPEIGCVRFCGSVQLYWPDGRRMRGEESPMARTLAEGRPCLGGEALMERPDGSRVPIMTFPGALKDAEGRVTGGVNLLVDITARKEAEIAAARLGAIVSSSDDAIVSKTLDGIVTTWNDSATRIFGYSPEEMIGQSIKRIIPSDLQAEEDGILSRLRAGERIDHFDTVRIAKDGHKVEVSLTVSPICDTGGNIIGASKVAREIGERKRHEAMQRLLLDELNHRVKNTLATIQSLASQTGRGAESLEQFVDSFSGRIQALARVHDLLTEREMSGAALSELIVNQVVSDAPVMNRILTSGPEVMFEAPVAVQMALVLHELATNARKCGALSVASGRLSITWTFDEDPAGLRLDWEETGVPGVAASRRRGFGTKLVEKTLSANGGSVSTDYADDGLRCRILLPLPPEAVRPFSDGPGRGGPAPEAATGERTPEDLVGLRVLLVEDEPLVAMDLGAELEALGVEVVGPASTIASAERFIGATTFDAALVDGNLKGQPADRVAAALTRKGVPFAFATGYGPEALPAEFREAPILTKPVHPDRLTATLLLLLTTRTPRAAHAKS